jgi:uracil-DNA glycosylase family 4
MAHGRVAMSKAMAAGAATEPCPNCPRCPRLVDYRLRNRQAEPDWHNAPVASFGAIDARLLIVGLAPGVRGANRTGRPFTGDFAGDLLYATLIETGLASGSYRADPADGLTLVDTRITNAVRCVPPQNKPTPAEIATCRDYLAATMRAMPRLRAILVLGRIAHESTLAALGQRRADFPFGHGTRHDLPEASLNGTQGKLRLHCSYHCSRYNTQTRRLTPEMFKAVVQQARDDLD